MIIYALIFILFLAGAVFSYKQSLFIWIAFAVFFNIATCLRFAAPSLTLTFSLNCIFIGLFLYKYSYRRLKNPFLPACLIFVAAHIIAAVIPSFNLGGTFLKIVQFAVNDFVILFVLFALLRTRKDIKLLMKYLTVAVGIALVYGFITFLTRSNPIIDFEIAVVERYTEEMKIRSYISSDRGVRVQSFFMSPFLYSLIIVSYLYLLLIINAYFPSILKMSKQTIILIFGTIGVSVFLSNSRSAILPFVLITPLLLFRMSDKYRGLIFALAGILVLIFPFIIDKMGILTSVFDNSSQVSGSSVSMREKQYLIAINSFLESPLWGHGLDYMGTLKSKEFEIYGAESVWIPILVEQGIIGVILYILFYWRLLKLRLFKGKLLIIGTIPLYYLFLVTMNGAVNIGFYSMLLALIVIYKLLWIAEKRRLYRYAGV